MKKILTILAAVTGLAAFGIIPEFKQSGTSFESYGDRPFDPLKDDAGSGSESGRYWFTTDTDAANVLSNYVGDVVNADQTKTPTGVSRPDYFAPSNNTKYLSVETTGKLFRTIDPNDGNAEFLPHEIPVDGIYLDTLVKFTAADSVFGDDALADGDKIAIEYVEHEPEDENDVAITNFVIRAGYVDGNNTQTNYYAAVPEGFNKDEWHRLTVRSIKNVGDNSVGFIIYLDGDMSKMLTYSTSVAAGNATYTTALAQNSLVSTYFYNEDVHALFPSAVRSGDDASSISAVAFSGNGSLDDVVFTTDKPGFINETTSVTVTWDPEKVVSIKLNGEDVTVANGSTTYQPTNGVVSVAVVFVQGYVMGACTTSGEGEWNGTDAFINLSAGEVCNIVAMQPRFEVGEGVYFDDLEDAIDAAQSGTSASPATFKLLANCAEMIKFTSGYVILDLAGYDIQGTDEQAFSVVCQGAHLTVTNSVPGSGAVKRPVENEDAAGAMQVKGDDGAVAVYVAKFDDIISVKPDSVAKTAIFAIYSGTFIDTDAGNDPDEFAYNIYVQNGATVTSLGNNYFQVGGAAQPIGTYQVTVTPNENATYAAAYKVGGETITPANDVLTVTVGQTIVITATPKSGYEYAEVPTGWTAGQDGKITIEVSAAGTVAIPGPTATAVIEYVTLTITPVANCTIVVSNATAEVATGTQFNKADAVQLTVYRTPADGYVLDNCAATETITMNQDQTVTAAVKVSGGYPTYIDTEDADEKAKYDAWKAAMTTAGVDVGDGEAYEDAYLLNCKPAEVTAEKAEFKFTKIAFEGGVWVTETTTKNTSGADYNGTVTVTRYSDVGCTTESSTGTFFKAFLQ